MMKFVKPVVKPCSDCPFRRVATPGWLGASSPEGFIDCMNRDEPLPCHQTIDYADPDWAIKWMDQQDTGKMCAGALIFMANRCQRPRADGFPIMASDNQSVFSSTLEFVRYHRESAVRSWNDKEQSVDAQLHQNMIARSAEQMGTPIVDFRAKTELKARQRRSRQRRSRQRRQAK